MRPVVVSPVGRRAWRLLVLMGCLSMVVLGLGAVEARAAAPSSLAGETFTGETAKGALTGTCTGDPTGPNPNEGSFNFAVSGAATGPFPGTFTESGSFSAGPSGYLTGFSSTFTITSPAGTVTGTKRLLGQLSRALCTLIEPGTVNLSTSNLSTTYTATIPGVGQDTGSATVSMNGTLGAGGVFGEIFGSAGGPPPLTSKEQCKHGGWRTFGTAFKNQGDCVAFVASGGKNPPSVKVR